MGRLYIVGVPIGNPEDITLRALKVIKEAEAVFCEDTRVSSQLFNRLGLPKKILISVRSQNEERSVEKVLAFLREGKDVCYVSDAGTPGISDPGAKLVRGVRAEGGQILPIPGVSAFTTIVSVSPYADSVITFEGFLPQKGEKRLKRLKELYSRDEAFIIYESPYRILKLLEELCQMDKEARILIGREMTKKFEEFQAGTSAEIKAIYTENPERILGEFCLLVSRHSVKRVFNCS